MAKFTLDSKLKQIWKNPAAKEAYLKVFPGTDQDPQFRLGLGLTVNAIAKYAPEQMTAEKLEELEKLLAEIE